MDTLEYNRQAWKRESLNDGEWSVHVSEEIFSAARNGAWQQAPVIAAVGAIVVQSIRTDNSSLTLIHDLQAPSPWRWLLGYGYRLTRKEHGRILAAIERAGG